jgi:hypothetical protein
MRREDAKLLDRVFFSHFAKKLRMEKPDGKLLEMLRNGFSFQKGSGFWKILIRSLLVWYHEAAVRRRASPTVWQILFPKSYCLPTPKIIWGEKKDLISNSLANFVSKNPKTR